MTPLEKLLERIDNAKQNIIIFDLISPVLRGFDGKKITRRIATKVTQMLESQYTAYTCYYDTAYGMFHLNIRKRNHEMRILIGYNTDTTFNYEKFLDWNRCYTLDNERLVKYEEAVKLMDEWELQFEKIKWDKEELKKEMARYDCEFMIDWRTL